MKTAKQCDDLAEEMIFAYCQLAVCHDPDDIRKALEMLISKAARGIEKYCGNEQAIHVLTSTFLHVDKRNGGAS